MNCVELWYRGLGVGIVRSPSVMFFSYVLFSDQDTYF